MRDDMGITNTQAGFIAAANVGAYLLATLFVAWATNRYLLLNVMRLGLIMATLGLLLASVSSSPLLLAGPCSSPVLAVRFSGFPHRLLPPLHYLLADAPWQSA